MAAILTRPQCVNTKSLLQMRCISIAKGLQICLYCLILKLMFGPSYNLDRIQLQFQIDCLHWLCGWRHVSCVWLLTGLLGLHIMMGCHESPFRTTLLCDAKPLVSGPFHWWTFSLFNPMHNEVVGGYIGFTPSDRPSVRPSIHPTSGVRSVAPTVLVGSILYLYILSSNFRRYAVFKVSRILKFEILAIFKNL